MFSKTTFLVLILCSFAHFVDRVDGACTNAEQTEEVEKCEKAFVDAMAKDSKANCSAELTKIEICLGVLAKKCYPSMEEAQTKQLVEIAMKQFKSIEFYCSSAKNIEIKWSNIAPAIRAKLPCNTLTAGNQTSMECHDNFRKQMLDIVRDSAAILKSYDESKICIKKETDNLCHKSPQSKAVTLSASFTLLQVAIIPLNILLV